MSLPLPVLEVWDATGATNLGVLRGYSDLTVSEVLSEPGSLQFSVPRSVSGADLLDTDEDRQICLRMPGATPMWWVVDEDSSTWISDDPDTEPMQVSCRSLHALLDEAVVGPQDGVGATTPSWSWTDATPGQIVQDVVTAAQARGLLQGVTLDCTPTLDASGTAWPETLTVTHQASTTILAVLAALRDAGLAEHRWVGRTLEVHRPSGAMDRTLDVTLRPRRDVLAAPLQRARKSQATAVIVEAAAGETVRRTQTLAGRRAREVWVTETDLDATTAAPAAGDLYLAAHTGPDVGYTHELTAGGGDNPRPWVDYLVGDRVVTAAVGRTPTRRRVAQITLTMTDSDRVTLELGSILRTAEETLARRLAKLTTESAVS